MAGILHVVATPIGNLGDLAPRAVEVLAAVDCIAAEDTRRTQVLLALHGIAVPMTALHEHNEVAVSDQLVQRLVAGESIALVCDAGTPLISDPGYRLLNRAIEAGVEVRAVPGPSAVTAALSVSGLPPDRFTFEGFLPARPAARRAALEPLRQEVRTMVFFESSHRISACLEDLVAVLGADRKAAVCRELTKQFETVLRGDLAAILRRVADDPDQRRGEFVIVVRGAEPVADARLAAALALARALNEFLPGSQAARIAAKIEGASRRDVYRELGLAEPAG